MYRLLFKRSVAGDLKRIGREGAARILEEVRKKLLPNPKAGKPLRGKDGILWSFRVGDYRVIYTFDDKDLVVLLIKTGHRKSVYRGVAEGDKETG